MDSGVSLNEKFRECELALDKLESSELPAEKVDEISKSLTEIREWLSDSDLFSSNDAIEDIPTISLQYLLVDAYLGYFTENKTVPFAHRLTLLQEAKRYYGEYLLTSDIYGFNAVPAKPDTGDAAQHRVYKVQTSSLQIKLSNEIRVLLRECQNSDDEMSLRSAFIKKLNLWTLKAASALCSIETEIHMLEHRQRMMESEGPSTQPEDKPRPLKTFTIPRLSEKKKVFGLGYPSAPKQTVDEWYDHMVKTGRFPNPSQSTQQPAPSTSQINTDGDAEDVDMDSDEEEQHRQDAIRKDEYYDSHRREMESFNLRRRSVSVSSTEDGQLPDDDEDTLPSNNALPTNSGKMWTKMIIDQSLEEELKSAGNLAKSSDTWMRDRGTESYVIPKETVFEDEKKSPKVSVDDTDLFDVRKPITRKEFNNTDSGFGPKIERKRKWEPSQNKRPKFNKVQKTDADTASVSSEKRERRGHFLLLREDFSYAKLYSAKIGPKLPVDVMIKKMATALGELDSKPLEFAVNLIGVEKSLSLFNATVAKEKSGGMKTAREYRRRTPGGVFFELLKTSDDIEDSIKEKIADFGKQMFREKQKLNKKRKGKNKTEKSDADGTSEMDDENPSSSAASDPLPSLPMAAERFLNDDEEKMDS